MNFRSVPSFFLVGCLALCGSPSAELTVCDALEGANLYNGTQVKLRGEQSYGGHGTFLKAPPSCGHRLVTKGVEWPNVIFLTYPKNQLGVEEYRADFEVDWTSVEAADRAARRIQRMNVDWKVYCVVESVIGKFVAMSEPEKHVNPPRPGGGNILGFGPVGLGAPAQMLIQSIGEPSIMRRGSPEANGICAPPRTR